MDLSVFTTPEAWISLVTLLFLEIVLGVDNLVFIAITTNRLPAEKQHLGRRLGLIGALVSRIIFLCFASYLVHMTSNLFTIPGIEIGGEPLGFSVRDLVLFLGGLYLIYKGISEIVMVLSLTDEKQQQEDTSGKKAHQIGMAHAVALIMVMDIVFSIDSVITAVGLAQHLIVMILAVMIAVFLMIMFVDAISDFINAHDEMKILALVFIVTIGVLLVLDGLGVNSGIEIMDMHAEKVMVYFAMLFAVIIQVILMRHNANLQKWKIESDKRIEEAPSIDG